MSVRSEKKARYRQIRQDFGIGIDGDGNGNGDGLDVGIWGRQDVGYLICGA